MSDWKKINSLHQKSVTFEMDLQMTASYNRLLHRFVQVVSTFAKFPIKLRHPERPYTIVNVSPDMSIYDVKVMIAEQYKNLPEENHLFLRGNELQDTSTIGDYEIKADYIIDETLQVFFENSDGFRYMDRIDPEMTIRDVVQKFSVGPGRYIEISVDRYRISHNGIQLDLNRKIKDYPIYAGETLLITRPFRKPKV